MGQQGIFRTDQVTWKRIPVGEAAPLPCATRGAAFAKSGYRPESGELG